MTESERRNLFTYAAKELSQDAFLMWLFNNYDGEQAAPVVYALLREFYGDDFKGDEKIVRLETRAQEHHIDISVYFETDAGKKYALFIEDKVDAVESYQLERYNSHTGPEGRIVEKVFYKTALLYGDEKERVEKAGWKPYDLYRICELLEPYETACGDPVVRQYIGHILSRRRALSATEMPQKDDTQLDHFAWLAFYGNTAIPHLKEKFGESGGVFKAWIVGQYSYVCLSARHRDDDHVPYLEIRSRDCLQGKFTARILCYGMNEADISKQEALIGRIKESGLFECKNLHRFKKGQRIFPKQIGYTKEGLLQAGNAGEFLASAESATREFLGLMRDWE